MDNETFRKGLNKLIQDRSELAKRLAKKEEFPKIPELMNEEIEPNKFKEALQKVILEDSDVLKRLADE